MSSQRILHDVRPEPDDPQDDVLFSSEKGVRIIELNRPQKLNSLNASMIRKIIPRLREWEQSQLANAVVIRSTSPKAFCAGGDVASIVKAIIEQTKNPSEQQSSTSSMAGTYFALEYQLDHLIASYRQPYISLMDGITMGGGVGLSCHAPFRIATEKTVFAMPETTIGFFPDVGATFFLPRLDGNVGKYLATTSDRLNGIDALYSGIATHYMHSSSLPDVIARIGELDFPDSVSYSQRLVIIAETLQEYTNSLPFDVEPTLVGPRLEAIERCFSHTHPMGIIRALEQLASDSEHDQSAWAQATIENIRLRSPTSVAVACRQMQLGKSWTIEETFRREHALATHLCAHPDFVSGVRSRLLDKPPTKPSWQPATLEEVEDAEVEKLFRVEGARMNVLKERQGMDYKQYPWDRNAELRAAGGCGLPREADVKETFDVVVNTTEGADEVRARVVQVMISRWPGKEAVRTKVRDVLSRRTAVQDEKLRWI